MVMVGLDEDQRNRFKDVNLSRLVKNHIDGDIQKFYTAAVSKSPNEQVCFTIL